MVWGNLLIYCALLKGFTAVASNEQEDKNFISRNTRVTHRFVKKKLFINTAIGN
jgi:C4-dicarboxylate-specific signal transduction histidine kinase